jgi:hypothetical protein
MTLHKEVLYDVKWQSLRVDLLGDFRNFEGTKVNVGRLSGYIRSAKDKIEKGRRIWRVLNLLNAVRMGYHGQKLVGTLQDKYITLFRNSVQEQREKYEDIGKEWDWNKVKDDVSNMDDFTRKQILKNLKSRVKMSHYKTGSTKNRPELMKFIGLLEGEE